MCALGHASCQPPTPLWGYAPRHHCPSTPVLLRTLRALVQQVIMFNSTARSMFTAKPIAETTPTLEFKGGGTEFGAPLRLALEHMRAGPLGTSPTLIFM